MKINHPLVKGYVKKIKPNIYSVVINDTYDRCMLFCRYQEFYESPIKGLRGQYVSFSNFMKKYKDFHKKDNFTYPTDWAGFNIPSDVLVKAINKLKLETEYDEIMGKIISFCQKDTYSDSKDLKSKWYLIGVDNPDSTLMDHELAHGLYYTNKEYKKNCDSLISEMKKRDYNFVKKALINIGYLDNKKIIDDEIQAFLSSELYKTFNTNEIKEYSKKFKSNFKKFKNEF